MKTSNQSKSLLKLIGESPIRLAIGNFDGVHIGHRRLISTMVSEAQAAGQSSVIMTFNPHPSQYFGRIEGFKKIDTPVIQRRILAELGVTGLLEVKFDGAVAGLTAEQFLRDLVESLPLKEVTVGSDFRFGQNRVGNVELLALHGKEHGYTVSIIEKKSVNGEVASSSSVRLRLIQEGDVEGAARILGRAYCLQGTVVKGDQVGRTIGFPTANIGDIQQLIPMNGVYAGRMKLLLETSTGDEGGAWLPCVINIGMRPTISQSGVGERRIEAHIYEASGANLDIYGRAVEIEFTKHLRAENRFDGLDSLKTQIAKDIAQARA